MSKALEFILDASVAMAWGFDDDADPLAEAVLDLMPTARAHVPALWPMEVANALLAGERGRRITPADTVQFLSILGTFPIAIDDESTARAWGDSLGLARARGLSVYDASYLELAMRRGLPIATLDANLRAAATAVGVPLLAAP